MFRIEKVHNFTDIEETYKHSEFFWALVCDSKKFTTKIFRTRKEARERKRMYEYLEKIGDLKLLLDK